MREIPIVRSQTGRSTSCASCLSIFYYYYTYNRRNRKDRRQAYSLLFTDDNGTPATWTLVLFQQAIDRQDRTLQTEGRFSLLEPLEIQP